MYVIETGFYQHNPFCYVETSSQRDMYNTFEEAVAAAKVKARRTQEDVGIWTKTHVVKFPEPAFEVVEFNEKS